MRLNKPQLQAVQHTDSHLLVLAGAGSGKTRVIIAKITHLLEHCKAPPSAIIAITFTNKAAGEIQQRIEAESKEAWLLKELTLRTFHSFGARFLRHFIHLLPPYNNNFTIYDEEDRRTVLNSVRDTLHPLRQNREEEVKALGRFISNCKNDLVFPDHDLSQLGLYDKGGWQNDEAAQAYQLYQEELKRSNALDFDDLIALPLELLEHQQACSDYVRATWRYLLIDEYQDTNWAQECLVRKLAALGLTVTAVGDDDQSIYGFRGARLSNIYDFPSHYPAAQLIKLEENYRSSPPILELANEIISGNQGRKFPKKLFSKITGELLPVFKFYQDDREEAKDIAMSLATAGKALNSSAIFYRSNAESRIFEDQLHRLKVPYQIIGSHKFYQRKEIKDIVAYLKLIANPEDSASCKRIINFPPRGLGAKSLAKLSVSQTAGEVQPLLAQVKEGLASAGLAAKAAAAVEKLLALIQEFQSKLSSEFQAEIIEELLERSGILAYYQSLKDENEKNERLGNLGQFIESVREFQKENQGADFNSFLQDLSLRSDIDELNSSTESLKMMTIHNAKGLEFDTVYLVGLEEDNLPHFLSKRDFQDTDEERRLFYVAVTRARQQLFISGAARKRLFNRIQSYNISSFIEEIDKSKLEFYNLAGEQTFDYYTNLGEDTHEYF